MTPVAGKVRLLAGSFLGVVMGLVAMTSLEAILVPLQNEFGLSVDDITTLALTVAAGSMLILFAAGALVDRLGPRRILTIGVVIAIAGAVLVAFAVGFGWLMAGRVVGGFGATAMAVSSLAIINATFTQDRERAYIFGYFGAVIGAVAMVSPVIGGLIVEFTTWRLVPLLWIVVAVTALLLVRGCPVPTGTGGRGRELFTPIAAGVAMSSLCVSALLVKRGGTLPVVALTVSVIALLALILRWRGIRSRGERPTLDLSMFTQPGARPLMVALLAVGAVNVFFYAGLFLQYRLGFNPSQTALLFVIPQFAGILGGLLGGWVSARLGSLPTTALALVMGCAACLVFLTVGEASGVVHFVAVLAAFTLAAGCLAGTLTKAFLDCATPESSGAAASWRQAGWSLGATLGGVVTGAVVFSTFSSMWQSTLQQAGVPADAARWAAESVRGGVPLTQVAADPVLATLPAGDAIRVFVGLAAAQLATFRLVAVLAFISYAVTLMCVLLAMRSRRTVASG